MWCVVSVRLNLPEVEERKLCPLRHYASCVSTTLTVLTLHNVESVYFSYSNSVYLPVTRLKLMQFQFYRCSVQCTQIILFWPWGGIYFLNSYVKWNYKCTYSWPSCSRVKTNINWPFILQLPAVCFSLNTDVWMCHILLRSDLQYTRTRSAQESVTDGNLLCGRCTNLYEGGYTLKPLCSDVT